MNHAARVARVLDEEEDRFTRTVEVAVKKFDALIAEKRLANSTDEELEAGQPHGSAMV